jgi:drug/metabolite transporter (DMT)-like permease
LLGTVAPAVTALLGWVLAGEHLGPLGWTGIAVTMAGAWLATRR